MMMPGNRELLQARVVELIAKRNSMLGWILNREMQLQAKIVDAQIEAIKTMLDADTVPQPDYSWPEYSWPEYKL